MKKHNSFFLLAFAAIVLSSCNQNEENQTVGSWDGNDYNTGKDTLINNHTYYFSSYGYWYWYYNNQVTRYYPRTGYTATLPADEHRSGSFLSSSAHTGNGGATEEPATFSSGRGGTVTGSFGSTARGTSFGGSAHEGGGGE
jgi:hypothetical protein